MERRQFDDAVDVLIDAEKQNPDNLFVKEALSRCYLNVGAYAEALGLIGDVLRHSSQPDEKAVLKLAVLLETDDEETGDLFEIFGLQRPDFEFGADYFKDSPGVDDNHSDYSDNEFKAAENRIKGSRTRDYMQEAIGKNDYEAAVRAALEFPADAVKDCDPPLRNEIAELALRAAFLAGDKELAMAFAVSAYKRSRSFAAADVLLRISLDFGNESLFKTYFDTFFNDFIGSASDLRWAVELIKSAYSLGRYDEAFSAAETVYSMSRYYYDLNIIYAVLNAVRGDFTEAEQVLSVSERVLPRCGFFGYFREVISEARLLQDRRDRYIATRLVADDAWEKFARPNWEEDRNISSLHGALRLRLRRERIIKDLKRPYNSRSALKTNKTLIGSVIAPLA